jgi:predicted acylesterase/phospholipase RssA
MTVDPRYAWNGRSPPLLLALTGGGFRGYFTALVLAELEQLIGAPCGRVFNLISGTSIGGIIAIGLAFGIPARTIADSIARHGASIFPPLRFKRARRLFGPPYASAPIEQVLRCLLGDRVDGPLGAAPQNVMVVTASPGTARMEVLASFDAQRTAAISVLDAALATAAAPTYFPARRVGLGQTHIDLLDGGIAANAPDAVAIHHAVRDLAFPEQQIVLLSIGTCASVEGAAAGRYPARAGLFGALTRLGGRGIVNLMMAIQEARGTEEARVRLGADRWLRIDRSPSDEDAAFLELDNASQRSRLILGTLADAAHQEQLSKQDHNVWRLLRARAQAVR